MHQQDSNIITGTRPDTAESCKLVAPGPFGILIFGATGDLSRRKLLPALYRLMLAGLMPESFFVLGASMEQWDDAEFRDIARGSLQEGLGDKFVPSLWGEFAERLHYEPLEINAPDSFAVLKRRLLALESQYRTGAKRLFYLAVPPELFEPIVEGIGNQGLAYEGAGMSHIVVEKPFGRDLASSAQLGSTLERYFKEKQIYRMDHYLAKETVQNILMFRFANSIFDSIWDRKHIDHVQITVSETLGVESRAGYYESSGVLRDMFQNHIFQLLALTAMEPPSSFEAELVRDEKVKVFRAVRPIDLDSAEPQVVIAQYGAGEINGKKCKAYRDEEGVSPGSLTPTFAAMKVYIDNWRWRGVPFYLRSGKRMSSRHAEISVQFKEVPHMMFLKTVEGDTPANVLTMRVQPDEGISLSFHTKAQGTRLCLSPVLMDFSYDKGISLSGYERVLLDCLVGDQTLFVRSDGVRRNWEIFTPVIERLESTAKPGDVLFYGAGTEGPGEAHDMLARDNRHWRPLAR